MKKRGNAARTASYASGIIIIASAFLLAVLLFMCAFGLIFPRRERIALRTESLTKTYDHMPISGGVPILTYGKLHPGHKITTLLETVCTEVGVYPNEPKFIITDGTGADVTDMYEISADYGEIVIEGRPITVYAENRSQVYNGEPLYSGIIKLIVTPETLFEGHTFICTGQTSITDPGEVQIEPLYSIIDEYGQDVTNQYKVTEELGTLTVKPIPILVYAKSVSKFYDGQPISTVEYSVRNDLLKGHVAVMTPKDEYINVGTYENTGTIDIFDESGNNVSELYDITIHAGTIEIKAIDISIITESAEKVYDGAPLTCDQWIHGGGNLIEGDTLSAVFTPSITSVGSIENRMIFAVTDSKGNDVTDRYNIYQLAGVISVTPRQLTVRTGSASKVYDGKALMCEEYELTLGSVCEGESLELAFASMTNIGFMENYIAKFTIYKTEEDGTQTDVSMCYSVSFDCGTLTITAN